MDRYYTLNRNGAKGTFLTEYEIPSMREIRCALVPQNGEVVKSRFVSYIAISDDQ